MTEILNTFLLVVAGLFPIVNPLGSAPIFLTMTSHCTDPERNSLAANIAVNGFLLLLGSIFFGTSVLEFFGITLPVVRIAGGLVVLAMGWKILSEGEVYQDHPDVAVTNRQAPPEGFYPLTMPLTVGPGSISVAIALGSRRPPLHFETVTTLALMAGSAVAGLLVIAVSIYLSYRFAGSIARILGPAGVNVLVRLSAFILMCIGIEILWTGYSALTPALGH